MQIPVVISHSGDDEYFKAVVIITSQKNLVYVIGDEANSRTFKGISNVHHIRKEELYTPELLDFEEAFVNYSSNSHEEELRCFRRVFLVHQLMKLKAYAQVFHMDSDCILLEEVGLFCPANSSTPVTAYPLQINSYPFLMVGSIHNALLSLEFCSAFAKLCNDIYVNKSKFNLILPKINWHRENGIGGGICDMTMYYLLNSESILPIINLNQAFLFDEQISFFDHNISMDYGPLGDGTFLLKNGLKKVLRSQGRYYCEARDGSLVRAMTLHFQGGAKKFIPEIYALGNF